MEVIDWGTNMRNDDFLTPAPYEQLYKSAKEPFRHARELEALASYAASKGFKGFKGMYRAYVTTMREQRDTVYVDNVTAFDGQPMELNAGDWEADEGGVCRKAGYGYETGLPASGDAGGTAGQYRHGRRTSAGGLSQRDPVAEHDRGEGGVGQRQQGD